MVCPRRSPKKPSTRISLKKLRNHKPEAVDAEAPAADDILDLVQKIKDLNKEDAIARLLERNRYENAMAPVA